jgi:hypothetical protein
MHLDFDFADGVSVQGDAAEAQARVQNKGDPFCEPLT